MMQYRTSLLPTGLSRCNLRSVSRVSRTADYLSAGDPRSISRTAVNCCSPPTPRRTEAAAEAVQILVNVLCGVRFWSLCFRKEHWGPQFRIDRSAPRLPVWIAVMAKRERQNQSTYGILKEYRFKMSAVYDLTYMITRTYYVGRSPQCYTSCK